MFRSKRQAPPTVPTDRVIPVNWMDSHISGVHMYFLTRFDDVLDDRKLSGALDKLLHRDDWRKLGARLRRNDKGKFEFHVPAEFTEKRPAVAYQHQVHDCNIGDHPTASRMPRSYDAAEPRILCRQGDFFEFLFQEGDPESVEDFLYSDRPMLGLRITSFNDATLVWLTWSHLLLDGMGRKALVDAWSLVLQGRDDEVLPLHAVDFDPLEKLGTQPTVPYVHADKQMGMLQSLLFGLRILIDKIWLRSHAELEVKLVCVTASHLQSMRQEAMATITEAKAAGNDTGVTFASDGDIICAWWLKLLAKGIGLSPSTPVPFSNAFGLRWLLTDVLPLNKAYVANAVTLVPTFFTAGELLKKPLGLIAAAMRKSLVDLGTREQIEARVALDRATLEKTGRQPLFGSAGMQMTMCTNWSKGKFFDIDFSAAVVKDKQRDKQNPRPGRPTAIMPHARLYSLPFTRFVTSFVIMGKDAGGHYWLHLGLAKDQWTKMEKFFPPQSLKE